MYMGGQLVHADYMFNGYGTTKRDFMKQVGNVPVIALFLGCLWEEKWLGNFCKFILQQK